MKNVVPQIGPLLILLILYYNNASAHGGVAMEDDICLIRIGFFKAHFTGYQPKTHANKEFCEDIPEIGDSVFVIDYIDNVLKQMPIDFRVIKDIKKFGVNATWDDIRTLKNLDAITVYYQPMNARENGVLTAKYKFQESGHYIGLISAQHPTLNKTYTTVFPFSVGISNYSLYWIILLALAVQGIFWINNNGLANLYKKLKNNNTERGAQ